MYYILVKDKKRRFLWKKFYIKNLILKCLYKITKNFYFILLLNKITKNSSYSRIINRCIYTSKKKSSFFLSRHFLKKYLNFGKINGFRKSSW